MSTTEPSSAAGKTALIGIDWGTTHLRAYRIDDNGTLQQRRESDVGIGAVRDQNFADVLEPLVADWQSDVAGSLPMLMCGMIGSRRGWREVPYCRCPAGAEVVVRQAVDVDTRFGKAKLLGGIACLDARGRYDVMRGEETLIFGAVNDRGPQLIIAPGTHCKWVVLRDVQIERFRTYMTGEIYALLRQYSTLGWSVSADQLVSVDDGAFLEGVNEALEVRDLLHALFSVRTRALFDEKTATAMSSYLSGMLIGTEVVNALHQYTEPAVTLIANSTLSRLYRLAFSAMGVNDVQPVGADDAVVRGLWLLHQLGQGHA